VLHAPEDLATYAYDATPTLRQRPDCVVFPATSAEVADLVRFAHTHAIPLVTRGSGTGLSGGSVPVPGALVVCTARFDAIIEVDAVNRTMLVEPGVVTQRIADAAQEAGLFYPPDPGSLRVCTIGGNVAENAGGLRGLKYGVTRDYVMALEVVLPTGEIAWLGSHCVKDVAGYSLKDLFVGSEGTLGVVTKILLKLVPQPKARRTLTAVFDTFEQAAETGTAILAARLTPCTMEFLDRITIQCVEEYAKIGLPTDADALLLIECDGHPQEVEEDFKNVEAICRDHGASVRVASDAEEAEQLASARRVAFAALARRRPTTVLEDATVPRTVLAKMVRFIQETAKKHDLTIGTFGHLGDGNLHPTCLCDENDSEEMERVHHAFDEIFRFALELGGTITGEHGIGLAKKPWLEAAASQTGVELMCRLKQALDPKNILNPGKILG
jgi:glycolate oxidase